MDRVDSSQVPIFQTTSLQTIIVPGTSQYLLGESLKSPSSTLLWNRVRIQRVGESLRGPVFSSLMLLQMTENKNFSFVVEMFLLQCTLSEIPSK